MKADLPSALILGMAFHDKARSEQPTRGQGYRDRIRCEALERLNYNVRSLDNKHEEIISKESKHCQANFADARRMKSSMDELWPNREQYDHVILDYFFSPVSIFISTAKCKHNIVVLLGWLGKNSME